MEERPRGEWPIVAISWCVGLILFNVLVYRGQVGSLDTPEAAMSGTQRMAARSWCDATFAATAIVFGIMFIRYVVDERRRACALVPALALFGLYVPYRESLNAVLDVPRLEQNFLASREQLEALAEALRTGVDTPFPMQAGHFTIVQGELLASGAVVLYTRLRGFCGERWGFVLHDDAAVGSGSAGLLGFCGDVAEWSNVERLVDDWFVLYGRFHYVRQGWS